MAFVVTNRGSSSTAGIAASPLASGDTFTPTTGNLLIVSVFDSSATSFTGITGWTNTTFSEIAISGTLHIWAAIVGATPGSGTASLTWTGSREVQANVYEISGADTSGTTAAAFVQNQKITGTYNPTSPLSFTALAAFASATNLSMNFGACGEESATSFTIEAGYTKSTDSVVDDGSTNYTMAAFYKASSDTSQALVGTFFAYKTIYGIAFEIAEAPTGATISASDATATRGQTNYQFTYSGGDATPATATLSDGTNTAAITITTYNANGVCTCTIPSTIAIRHIATATLTVTDAVSGTPTASVDFQPATGMTFTNITSIAGTDADFTYGYAGATVASGKQVVYETPTLEDSLAIVVSADCSYTLEEGLTQNNTSDYYVIDADGTIGVTDTNTFLFSSGSSGTSNGGFISSFGKLGLR